MIQLTQWVWFGPLLVSRQRFSSGCAQSLWSQSILASRKTKLLLICLISRVCLYSVWCIIFLKKLYRNSDLTRISNSGSFQQEETLSRNPQTSKQNSEITYSLLIMAKMEWNYFIWESVSNLEETWKQLMRQKLPSCLWKVPFCRDIHLQQHP